MKKVNPINRALRPVEDTGRRVARGGGATPLYSGAADTAVGQRSVVQRPALVPTPERPAATREQLHGLFNEYRAKEQEQQFEYLEQRVKDAVQELNARIGTQEQQIQSLQNTLDSERRLSQSAITNLKDLFDGNYQVMADISDQYEDSQKDFEDDKANIDRRLEFIQQESHESTMQLRTAILQAQDEDRLQLAESLRALADSIDRK